MGARAHVSTACPPHAELAASLAFELCGELDSDRLERGLSTLSAAVAIDPDSMLLVSFTVGASSDEPRVLGRFPRCLKCMAVRGLRATGSTTPR